MKKQLHVISDGELSLSAFAGIAAEIEPFVDKFHIRDKKSAAKEVYEAVQSLVGKGVPLSKIIINDRADVAKAVCAGVHLAYHSLPVDVVKSMMPTLTAGCSVHTYEEAVDMERRGADYVLYGHVFATRSKEGQPPRGLAELTAINRTLRIPVLAIGGIKPEHVEEVLGTGADGIAVMSGILRAEDPRKAAMKYAESLTSGGDQVG